jgi:hypothetical protein
MNEAITISVPSAKLERAGVKINGENLLFVDEKGALLKECKGIVKDGCFPSRLTIRQGEGYRFVCGFDLILLGARLLLWVGGVRVAPYPAMVDMPHFYMDDFTRVAYVFNNVCIETKGKNWEVCDEDAEVQTTYIKVI